MNGAGTDMVPAPFGYPPDSRAIQQFTHIFWLASFRQRNKTVVIRQDRHQLHQLVYVLSVAYSLTNRIA